MQKAEANRIVNRTYHFLLHTKEDYLGEQVVFQAVYARSKEPVPYEERLNLKYRPIQEGDRWGDTWESGWFLLKAEIPESWKGREIACHILFSGEALIYGADGVPDWSLTGQAAYDSQYEKALYFPKADSIRDGKLELWVEAAANALFGVPNLETHNDKGTTPRFPGDLLKMRLALFNREAWQFRYDLNTLYQLYQALPEGDYRGRQILAAMDRAMAVYAFDPENAAAARRELAPILARPAMASACSATAVGHAHIDIGWLWPIRESTRKAARSYASQLRLIDEYPGYVFGGSQPQLYAELKKHYPRLFQRIKDAVAAGRIEPQGGMWVEADCNVISGESMVRQFLHGKNFFRDEFGVEVKNLWLPDVFGYSGAMPQIIRKSGCDYFLTQKISWSETNSFPYHSFLWEGIDGTKVLTHFPPENTYNARCAPDQVIKGQNNITESESAPLMLSLFGIGDGGGGPSYDHLERARRIANLEGCPTYTFGTAESFFQKLAEAAGKLPTWRGELYLELHRGTLTSQANTKRFNRKLEQKLVALEFLASALPPEAYPREVLDRVWKDMLCLQFHDILPGSSINLVYEETELRLSRDLAELDRQIAKLLPRLGRKEDDAILAVNSLGCAYEGCVELPEDWEGFAVQSPDGACRAVQRTAAGAKGLVSLAPSSIATLKKVPLEKAACGTSMNKSDRILENDLIRYEFDGRGQVISAFDKEIGRELFQDGKPGNQLLVAVDWPYHFDAWDVDDNRDRVKHWQLERCELRAGDAGDAFGSLVLTARISNSCLVQRIVLRSNSKRLDFETKVDWNEKHRLLYVAFPVDVFSQEASFDVQYGVVRRPVNTNTSWETAKFEVCGQRYADMSENGYGVALLNDCKYGYCTCKGQLELSLLRAAAHPDSRCEKGWHLFTYSLLPHTGALEESTVMDEAARLNRPPMLLPGRAASKCAPCYLSGGSVRLEVVKREEKGTRLVVRLVEIEGRNTVCTLHVPSWTSTVLETNLLEWTEEHSYPVKDAAVELAFKPYEIRTFILEG